jgi:hypothetical protein
MIIMTQVDVRAPSHTYKSMVERLRPTKDSVQTFSSGGRVRVEMFLIDS